MVSNIERADREGVYLGVDVGSVSLKIGIMDAAYGVVASLYRRTGGQPMAVLADVLEGLARDFPHFDGAVATGSARNLVSDVLGIDRQNEIITQAQGTARFHPEVKTIIEIGGQDSKLILVDQDPRTGQTVIVDHALNEICAAGTGSFLDQQANRLGVSIDGEFADLVLRSTKPANIAGRCAVFAKSDMTHLQQEGTPIEDILAGLCDALVRNYISNLGRGRAFVKPVVFQGGVAANKGVVKAFEHLLELPPGGLLVPQHYDVMGALGSAIMAMQSKDSSPIGLRKAVGDLRRYLDQGRDRSTPGRLAGLADVAARMDGKHRPRPVESDLSAVERIDAYLGIDVGASSVNVVALNQHGELLAKRYLLKEGGPIASVIRAMEDIGGEIGSRISVGGVGVTGSGRHFVGDFVGADVVVNEITAQAKATLSIDQAVDTIIEIGGQDSKYISLTNGAVVDFEMNKVCAAGTGSFLEEQANRLGIRVEEEFSNLALRSQEPSDLGTKCTVFMESDLIHHQQLGASREDLLAGLAYSIASNYVEKVVGNKKIGRDVYFQGGVAANRSVVAAFENILGQTVTVPENHDVTGAIGAALIAAERLRDTPPQSNFAGFNLSKRECQVDSFRCQHCANRCDVKKVTVAGRLRSFYGGICDRYDGLGETATGAPRSSAGGDLPDLFKEREEMLMTHWREDSLDPSAPSIGMPRILMFYEQFPLWAAFFQGIGVRVVLSDKTSTELTHRGLREVLAETCYPVKVAYGHILNLLERGVDRVFLPSVIDLEKGGEGATRSYNCPYVQGIPFILGAAFETRITIDKRVVFMAEEKRNLEAQMTQIGREFKRDKRQIDTAIAAGLRAHKEFQDARLRRGTEVLRTLNEGKQAVVVIGKPYNVHDVGLNLSISKKLRRLGVMAIPYDFLPLETIALPACYSNLVWENEQNLLRSAILARENKGLHPVMITNYGCGPDAFFAKYLEDTMGQDAYLVLEVDEHSGDAGMVTRLEAFLDTLNRPKEKASRPLPSDDLCVVGCRNLTSVLKPSKRIKELERTLYVFNGSGHAAVWAAAFRSVGLDARLLPSPDDASEALGRRHVSGRECHPYLVVTGDLAKKVQSRDFDPDKSAFVMLNADSSCRLSQYGLSQKMVLKRLGLGSVPVIAPITCIHQDESTRMFGLRWAAAMWKGWLAVDILQKKLLHVRPYEVSAGQTDALYDSAIESISSAIVGGGFEKALQTSIAAMDSVPVQRQDRPIVGVVGEFYSCMNPWANHDIMRVMESMGAEVRYGPSTTDYLMYFNEEYPATYLSRGEHMAALYYYVRRRFFMRWKNKLERMLGEDIYQQCRIPAVSQRVKDAAPYVTHEIDPVVTVNLSKAHTYANSGCAGIANLIVLNCLLGTLSTALCRKVQREHNGIPMLTIVYDGLKPTNEQTRIEAFMHQVKLHHERSAG